MRSSRGSKEGKRRRDARRNRRKLAAVHAIDQQLSLDIDRTLSQVNVPQPQQYRPQNPMPTFPPRSLPPPQHINVPPTPPELPYLNFGGLDLMNEMCRYQPTAKTPTPPLSPPLAPQLPSWCPPLPCITNNMKWSEFPLFFDLSKLPEPIEPFKQKQQPRCQEMQLWRPHASPQPKKQSRYFSPPSAAESKVELPSPGYKLHNIDQGIAGVQRQALNSVVEPIELAANAAQTTAQDRGDEQSDAYPANLWKILNPREDGTPNYIYDSDDDTVAYRPTEEVFAAPYGHFDHRLEAVGLPTELEDTQIPFVHGNSLTGHANECADYPLPPSAQDSVIFGPAEHATAVGVEGFTGMNEMAVDPYADENYTNAVLAAIDLVQVPPSPPSNHEDQAQHPAPSTHHHSEQALFEPLDDDIVDIAPFLPQTHITQCKCQDCSEPPELVGTDMLTEDEGWMVYSTMQEGIPPSTPPTTSGWEWEWGTFVNDADGGEEGDAATGLAGGNAANAAALEAFYPCGPCTPSSVAHGSW